MGALIKASRICRVKHACVLAILLSSSQPAQPDRRLPASDQRAARIVTANTPRTFPSSISKPAWESRAEQIREQILVSCGLWPAPDKTPLNPHFFGRVDRGDYSVEKVYFETYPGFYLAGNLYRPLGQGKGPFPAVLNPHGHWKHGRLENSDETSVPGRCIGFARRGLVAFSYDMVGYNDTAQIDHHFGNKPADQLWGISLMGLQTWNSIRALDFLASLPEVDPKRLACTGASGGGTQTFILGAADRRLAAQAPVVMVSHSFQGDCLCEGAPGLRLDFSNLEIAACPAPRPQLLVAATGDWTKSTLEVEAPAIRSIYRLFGKEDQFGAVRFNFGHNYNRTSREAVYGWFSQWLSSAENQAARKEEEPFTVEPDALLRVWADRQRPGNALDASGLVEELKRIARDQITALTPTNASSLAQFKKVIEPAWRHTVQAEFPERGLIVEVGERVQAGAYEATNFRLGREGKGDVLSVLMIYAPRDDHRRLVILADPRGKKAFLDASGGPAGIAKRLLETGQSIVLADLFLTGGDPASAVRDPFRNAFTTYNRTDAQERAQDLVTLCAFGQIHSKGRRVVLCGTGRAGLWALLAAPAADAVAADAAQCALEKDDVLLEKDLFVPGLRRIGSFAGVAALAAPHPLFVHNLPDAASKSEFDLVRSAYRSSGRLAAARLETGPASEDEIAGWIGRL